MKKVITFAVILLCCFCISASAHSGGTDERGGHYDSATGEYHYHHGYPAHQHVDGECPYDFNDLTNANTEDTVKDTLAESKENEGTVPLVIAACVILSIIIAFFIKKRTNKKGEIKMKQTTSGWIISSCTLALPTIALACAIAYLIFASNNPYNTSCAYAAGAVSIVCIALHTIFYMRKTLFNPIVLLCISVLQVILSFGAGVLYLNASVSNFYFEGTKYHTHDALHLFGLIGLIVSWIAIAAYLYYAIISIIRICRKDRLSEKAKIRIREKAYKKIDQYHDYLQKGIITEEEYNETRQRILNELKNDEEVVLQ